MRAGRFVERAGELRNRGDVLGADVALLASRCGGQCRVDECRDGPEQNVFQCATIVSLKADVAGSFWISLDFAVVLRSRKKSLNVTDSSAFSLVLPDRIELSTSPLPRECSTTELRQQRRQGGVMAGRNCHKRYQGARIAVATDAPCAWLSALGRDAGREMCGPQKRGSARWPRRGESHLVAASLKGSTL
jgi:hypothetical protein